MAGLGTQMQPPGAMPPDPQSGQPPAPDQQSPDDAAAQPDASQGMDQHADGEPATPEEQAAYEKMMGVIGDILYSNGKVNPKVLEQLSGKMGQSEAAIFAKADPPFNPAATGDALAGTSVLLLITADASLGYQKKANGQSDDDNPNYSAVLMQCGTDLISTLADDSSQAGIHDYSQDEINNGGLRAVDLYQQVSPTLDRGALKEKFIDLAMADKQGQMGKLLPQLPQPSNDNPPPDQQQAPPATPPAPAQGGGLGMGAR